MRDADTEVADELPVRGARRRAIWHDDRAAGGSLVLQRGRATTLLWVDATGLLVLGDSPHAAELWQALDLLDAPAVAARYGA